VAAEFANTFEGDVQFHAGHSGEPQEICQAAFLVDADDYVNMGASHLTNPRPDAGRAVFAVKRIGAEPDCEAHQTTSTEAAALCGR
jgi:hypothetical protein